MSRVRGLLERVSKLERRQGGGPSFFDIHYGSFDAFAQRTQREIDEGRMCPVDGPVILEVLRRWHTDGVKLGRARRQG